MVSINYMKVTLREFGRWNGHIIEEERAISQTKWGSRSFSRVSLLFYSTSSCLFSPLSFLPPLPQEPGAKEWGLLWLLWAAGRSDGLAPHQDLSLLLDSVLFGLWPEPPSPRSLLPTTAPKYTPHHSFGRCYETSGRRQVMIIIIIAWKLQLWNIMWLTEWTEAQLLFLG